MTRTDWTREDIAALFDLPFDELLYRAQTIHRAHHAAGEIQLCTLLSIKTGGCPEDCGYCSQSVAADSGVKATKLMDVRGVLQKAAEAKDAGSQRFCMGAAWRNPKDRDMPAIVQIVKGVRAMGLETCMTLGMLTPGQAGQLADAGLDYYNHNIDTSPERYAEVISTRTFEDRLETLGHVREAGINVCCGGIVGMGETRGDRVGFIHALATLPRHPESVPVNALVPVKGTVLGDMLADTPLAKIDDIEFVRTVAVARITMPLSMVRLSAGRESMSEATQALCFMAGANSIFTGDKLLTATNAGDDKDAALMAKLGLRAMVAEEPMRVGTSAMFNPFRKKDFEKEIRGMIAREFRHDLGNDVGTTLFYVFEALVERAKSEAGMPTDFIERVENSGVTSKAGAIALLDASVTGGKKLVENHGGHETLTSSLLVMEQVLDRMFLNHPTEVVPRNGKVGPSMNDFTKDWDV